MRYLFIYIIVSILVAGCQSAATSENNIPLLIAEADTIVVVPLEDTTILKPYNSLTYSKTELLRAAPGTKSVLFNAAGNRLYAMNLEGMSVYEFDQPSRKVLREFKFSPTKGTGWDYATDKPIPSYEEKPVEACFSHDDKFLWVSLHNADGIVPIRIDSLQANVPPGEFATYRKKNQSLKKMRVIYPGTKNVDSFYVPLIKTGKTPKIISRTENSGHLLVSNWHSYNVSVLETDISTFPYAKVVSIVPVPSIPRGIVVDDKTNRSYVAIMGGASITVINNTVWMKEGELQVASNPRHIVMDTSGHIFVSYNKLAKIACLDAESGKTLFTASTHAQPRTIILSKNKRFIFVTCYNSDFVEVFKIKDKSFEKVISLPCKGHPVGVDVFEDDEKLEAWVCSYSNGSISVFTFKKQ
ncbi:MAG: YncE family protein [Chitinophagaceae bacterium]|nr:YncE family protein [Chitinophagaceae bacterium]